MKSKRFRHHTKTRRYRKRSRKRTKHIRKTKRRTHKKYSKNMKGGADVSESDEKIAKYFLEKRITSVEETNPHLPKMAYDIASIMSKDELLPAKYSGRSLDWWKTKEGVAEAYDFLNKMFERLKKNMKVGVTFVPQSIEDFPDIIYVGGKERCSDYTESKDKTKPHHICNNLVYRGDDNEFYFCEKRGFFRGFFDKNCVSKDKKITDSDLLDALNSSFPTGAE